MQPKTSSGGGGGGGGGGGSWGASSGSSQPSPTASAGTYKGKNITPGSDAQIAAQMKTIDSGLLSTSPISKQIVTSPTGESTTVHYDNTPPVQTPPAPTGTPFSNTVNAGVGASANSYGQGTSNVNTGTGMTMNAVNNPNPNIATAQSGLLNIAANQTPEVKNAQSEFNTFSKANPYLVGNVGNNVAAEVASGRGQILGNELSKEQDALGLNVQNALQG